MPNGGGKKLRTPRQESIMRMKKDPQQLASMEQHCSNKMNSNSWRCEQLRQAQLEMYLGQETPTSSVDPKLMNKMAFEGKINVWMTHLDTLQEALKVIDESTGDLTSLTGRRMNTYACKALEAVKATSKTLQHLSTWPGDLALATSISAVYDSVMFTPDDSDQQFTAYANLGRDLFLLGLDSFGLTAPLGFCLGVLNSILVAADPNWFPTLLKNPNGELARRITQAAEKKLEANPHGQMELPSRKQLSEFSKGFRSHTPFH